MSSRWNFLPGNQLRMYRRVHRTTRHLIRIFMIKKLLAEMRSSTNLYLCALGCSDCAVICTAIFLFCIDSIRRYSLYLSLIFGSLSPLIYPAGMTAQTCSVYFTLVAGADCFVQVILFYYIYFIWSVKKH